MAHAEGWIEAYSLLEKGDEIPEDLKKTILSNRSGVGETMLHWYSIEGEPKIVEKIIELGFDVNTQNDFNATPLFEYVSIDRWDIVEILLRKGADTQLKDESDEDIWEHLEFMDKHDSIQKLKDLTNRFRQHGQARVARNIALSKLKQLILACSAAPEQSA